MGNISIGATFEAEKLIETMPDPIFIKGLDGEFIHCNSLFASMLGVDRGSIIGSPVVDVAKAEFARICDGVDRRLLSGRAFTDRYHSPIQNRATNERYMAQLIKSLYLDNHGKPLGFVCVVRSIKKSLQTPHAPKLSPRELEVLGLVAQGKSQKEISSHLSISIHTTAHHMKAIYIKMNVRNRVAAIAAANTFGLFESTLGG